MLEFIPIEYYTNIYYFVMLFVVISIFLYTNFSAMDTKFIANAMLLKMISFFLLFFIILYIGLRPISEVFVDMTVYHDFFERFKLYGFTDYPEHDFLFFGFMYMCSTIMSAECFFFICALIYILPIYIVSRRIFKKYWFYAFLMFTITFSFWAYGTNTIRNGMAASIFLLVFAYKSQLLKISIMLMSMAVHASMMLPAFAYIISFQFRNILYVLYGWILTILISFTVEDFIQKMLSNLIPDHRVSYLVEDYAYMTGFRWDFILYSSIAVFVGAYFIFRKKFYDTLYNQIYKTYLISNGIWILIIYANYSDRIAYLSWFMMGLVVIYPLLKKVVVSNQHNLIGFILLSFFSFSFFMNVRI